ncbi:MAG: SPFH/Band 7/PHB domain protein [Brevinematales bacterium]|nr:SPFH/Band 7/PHB domain protein [Brevinematales bacterium]
MTELIIFLSIAALALLIVIASSIKIIQQSQAMIIERLGRYKKTLKPGMNLVFPLIDKARKIQWKFVREARGQYWYERREIDLIDLREVVMDFPRQNVITKDNVTIEINAMLYYQVTDPVKATYEIQNLPDAIEKLTQTTLRNVIGELELDETLISRDHINQKLRLILDEATDKWGVKVNRVELQDINPPEDIKAAMEKQMRAERGKREIILIAEGEKNAAITRAQGEMEARIKQAEGLRQSNILQAEGEANARLKLAEAEAMALKKIAEAVPGNDPTQYLVAIKYVDAYKAIAATNENRVVFLPYESSALMGALGGIKELLENVATKK